MRRPFIVGTLVAGAATIATAAAVGPGVAGTTNAALTPAQKVSYLRTHLHPFLSVGALTANRVKQTFGATRPEPDARPAGGAALRGAAAPVARLVSAAAATMPANVRVNDPSTDTLLDQTTQSETAIAAAGKHVVVGYNDSQRFNPAGFTAAADLTGYAYSGDGGRTFTDGGVLPNGEGAMNFGDPWLGVDRAGTFYYSTLVGSAAGLGVGIARSTDGGATFSVPVSVNPPDQPFYFADKPALTVGRDPSNASHDNVYAAWDDFYNCDVTTCFNGLPLSVSRDGGATFTTTWAARITLPDFTTGDCSFGQYFGSQPVVDSRDGALHVFSTRIQINDPACDGTTGYSQVFSQVELTSTDGGATFGPEHAVATLNGGPEGFLDLAPGKGMRLASFVTAGFRGSLLTAVWADVGAPTSPAAYNLRSTSSSDGGATWSTPTWVTDGSADTVQPSLTTNGSGLHLAAYRRVGTTLSVVGLDSEEGEEWRTSPISSVSFPGVPNNPQFDPIIAPGYLGDYIASTSLNGRVLVAWGDNRDVVRNVLWPGGRNDPNVYFAQR